jgi:AraC-like DNA-binding protein
MARDKISVKGDTFARSEMSMPQWNFERGVISMRILTEFGIDHGVPAHVLLAGAGVSEAQLADPTCTVSGRQELQLMRNLVERLGDVPALGIEAGRRYHFTAFGALGLAIASSSTLRSALAVGQRFSELTFGFAQTLLEDTVRETRVTIDDSHIPEGLRRFIVECTTAAMISVGKDLVWSEPPLLRVSFRFPAPGYAQHYERFYGVKPSFNCAANVLALDRARLERPLPQANEHVLRLAEEHCRKLLETGRLRTGLTSRVRDRLEARLRQMPDMEEVANDLHMTPRTLRRRLRDEGTSFVELRDEVRMTLAEELLAGPRLSMEQLAERLGYADATSFVNAFKRCRGRTPHNFRMGASHASPRDRRGSPVREKVHDVDDTGAKSPNRHPG